MCQDPNHREAGPPLALALGRVKKPPSLASPGMTFLLLTSGLAVAAGVVPPPSNGLRGACLGEYSFCNRTGSCTLSDCTSCGHGEYRCPLPDLSHDPAWATCVQGAAGYLSCPNMSGTHLDWTLSEVKLGFEQIFRMQALLDPTPARLKRASV